MTDRVGNFNSNAGLAIMKCSLKQLRSDEYEMKLKFFSLGFCCQLRVSARVYFRSLDTPSQTGERYLDGKIEKSIVFVFVSKSMGGRRRQIDRAHSGAMTTVTQSPLDALHWLYIIIYVLQEVRLLQKNDRDMQGSWFLYGDSSCA